MNTGGTDLPAAPSAARTQWPAVLAAAGAGVAIATQVGKVPPAIGALRGELGLTLVQAGWVSSTLTTLAVLLALAMGLVVGRFGALRMLLGGLVLGAAASLAATAIGAGPQAFAAMLLARLVEGAGFLAVAVAAPALVSAAAAPADRRFALAVWATYLPLGAGLAMAASPLLLPATGWRGLWVMSAAALLLAGAAVLLQRRHYGAGIGPDAQSFGHSAGAGVLAVLRQPLPWLYGLAFALWAMQHYALIIWMPSFLREQRGLGPLAAALLTATMLLACVPGNLLGGALVQRGVPRGRLIAGAHLVTGLCGWACFSDALPDGLRFAASVLLSFTGGLVPTAALSASAVLARGPRQISAVQGLVMQLAQLGQFAGTPLIAAVVAATGQWQSARWVTAGAAAAGVALGLWAWRLERHGAASRAAPART